MKIVNEFVMTAIWHSERIKDDVIQAKQRLIRRKPRIAKANAKRRGYGFKTLNDWFEGCTAHHVDNDRVIYIPIELHKSYPAHRLDFPNTMIEINQKSFDFLGRKEMDIT